MIAYKEYHPGENLAPYIKCFWTYQHHLNRIAVQELAFSKGFLNLVFLKEGFFTVTSPGKKPIRVDESILAPHLTVPAWFEYSPQLSIFGASIYPWANPVILRHPCLYFTDEFITAEDIYGPECKEICQQVREKELESVVEDMKLFFGKLVVDENLDRPMQYAVKEIAGSDGSIEMDSLAKNMNLSSRRIQQKFQESIGFGPKYFARIIRFRQMVTRLPFRQENSLTSLAYEMNYSDQSHMIKEFKHFTGLSPARYLSYLQSSEQMLRTVRSEIKRDSC